MIVKPRQYVSINDALAMIGLELVIDGEDVDVCNAVGDSVMTKELQDWQIVFAPNYNNICTLPERKFPIKNAQAEFLWYMSGDASANAIAKFMPNWSKFADENGNVNSNYGVYWRKYIPGIIDELKRDKMSRRAVLNIFHAGNAPFGKDTPCTMTLQFLIRKNASGRHQLNLICNMRSNDIWYGLSIDQFCNSLLHQLVHHSLLATYPDLELGWYSHHAGSMHVYTSSSKGNATIDTALLVNMHNNHMNAQNPGERFEIDENVTFENFWETAAPNFETARFEHFKQIWANTQAN